MISTNRFFPFFCVAGLVLCGTTQPLAGVQLPDPVGNQERANSTVTRGSLRGVLIPLHNLQLSSRAAGVIERFGAEEGQTVVAGDLLVQLNADIERADIARAEAVLESTKAEWDRTKRELERSQQLRRDSIGSEKDLDDAQYSHRMATARQKQANADLAIV